MSLPAALVGAWTLTEYATFRNEVWTPAPGGSVAGQLIYTATGHVSVHLTNPGRERFVHPDWQQATDAEMLRAWPGYFAYFGTASVDEGNGIIIHRIEEGTFPSLSGEGLIRHYQLDDNRLILDADEPWGVLRLGWERAR